MAKIWFKEQYNFSGYSDYICGAPHGVCFYNGVAVCNDQEKLSWFRSASGFIVEDTNEELNTFERMDSGTLKQIVSELGIAIKDTDTKKEYVSALMNVKSRIN